MLYGVCLYPDLMDRKEITQKIQELSDKNINYVFTSIQLDTLNFSGLTSSWENFEYFFKLCKEKEINVSVDVSKDSIKKFNVTNLSDLSNVKNMGIYALRIDGGYDYDEIAEFTNNNEGIKIEINASMTHDLEELILKIKSKGNIDNLLACHNFFPRMNTGLSWKLFDKYNKIIRKYNIMIGAFVTTKNSKSKLCSTSYEVPTIEAHRGVELKYQIEDMKARGIDYIIISEDTYTSDDIDILSEKCNNKHIDIYVDHLSMELSDKLFTLRPDQPEFQVRFDERIGEIKPVAYDNDIMTRGSVTIDNVLNGRYSGEIQILLKDFPKEEYINVLGKVVPQQLPLLDSDFLLKNSFKLIKNH